MAEKQRKREDRRGGGCRGRLDEEVKDRAHFSSVLSNGTSSISPKRSLQSTKLLISNERPWNTVAKQLGRLIEQLIPVAQCPSLQFLLTSQTSILMNSSQRPVATHKKIGSSGKAANYAAHPYFNQNTNTAQEQLLLLRPLKSV